MHVGLVIASCPWCWLTNHITSNYVIAVMTTVYAGVSIGMLIQIRNQARAARDTLGEIKRQADLMERQTSATETASKAALKQIELVIDKERPRIFLKPQPFALSANPNDQSFVLYSVFPYCPTPAFIVEARAAA